ncbi:MAG: T9SS type A sorting domain-containing protein [Bacteroidia bacterium]|nr:T9SS type A sorting domain-containing protein [Bacteroidia bacterium]
MKKILLIATACFFSASFIHAQTVTSFAGKVNANPASNFSNVTADVDDAYFYLPEGLTWDSKGNLYVTESNKIRLIRGGKAYNRSGKLGDPSFSLGYKNGTGVAAEYYNPTSAVVDASDNVYIVDAENHAIRKLTSFKNVGDGQVSSTFAGANPVGGWGTSGYKDGSKTGARFNTPKGITMDGSGNLYVTDFLNHCIRKITASGNVTTLAGKGTEAGNKDATGGANVRFTTPYGIAMLDANTLVMTDLGNAAIRKVNISTGSTTTICGGLGSKDGSLAEARFRSPRGIAVVNGLIYVCDGTAIRVIDEQNGTVSTFAGSTSQTGNKDGVGADARFGNLYGMGYDGGNAIYVTDQRNHIIKKVTIDNLAPTADFSVTKSNIEINEEITITDISGGKPATKRSWKIEHTDGTTTNVVVVQGDLNKDKDITVKFKATGVYKVTLDVTNEFGNDVVSKSVINVSTVGINEVREASFLDVYPNPVTGNLINLHLDQGSFNNTVVRLMDLRGNVVTQETAFSGTDFQLNLPELAKGVYYVLIQDEQLIATKKVMVH